MTAQHNYLKAIVAPNVQDPRLLQGGGSSGLIDLLFVLRGLALENGSRGRTAGGVGSCCARRAVSWEGS